MPAAPPKIRLRETWNEEQVEDEGHKHGDNRDEVGQPHLNGIVAVECLLDKGRHESRPDEQEG